MSHAKSEKQDSQKGAAVKDISVKDKRWLFLGTVACIIVAIMGVLLGTRNNPSEWGWRSFFWSVVWPTVIMSIWVAILIGVCEYKICRSRREEATTGKC